MESVDGYGTLWYYWFVGESLESGQSPFTTDLFFYPYGKDMFADSGGNILDALLAWPLRTLLGPVLGTNLFILLGLLAAGGSFYLLARSLGLARLVSACGGVWFSMTPYALHELGQGRPTQGLLALLPIFLLFALRVGKKQSWRPVLGAGLVLAIIGYQYWYYLLFSSLVCLCLGAASMIWPSPNAGSRRAIGLRFAGIAGVALLVAAPGVIGVLGAVESGQIVGLIDSSEWVPWQVPSHSPDMGRGGKLLLWQPLSGLSQSSTLSGMLSAGTSYLPWALILGCAVWFWQLRSSSAQEKSLEPRWWLAMLGMAVVLALAPVLALALAMAMALARSASLCNP